MTEKPQQTEKPQKKPEPALLGQFVDVDALAASALEERAPVAVPAVRFAGGTANSEQDQAERVRRDIADLLGMPADDDRGAA